MSLAWRRELPEVTSEEFEQMKRAYRQRSDKELEEMLLRIHPLVRVYDKLYPMRRPFDVRRFTYAWTADVSASPLDDLYYLCEVLTLHPPRHGYSGIFKPTVGEVLDAIPDEFADRVRAFELFRPNDEDFRRQRRAMDEGYQIGLAVLYQ